MLVDLTPLDALAEGLRAGPHDPCPYGYEDLSTPWELGKHMAACATYVATYGEINITPH